MTDKPAVLIIGPTPPPFHGVAVAVEALLQSSITEQFQVHHLDLADRRGIQHVNKPDLHDVVLFCKQWLMLARILINERPRLTYLVLSQSTVGFLRDSLLLWPAYLGGSDLVVHLHGGNFMNWFLTRSWLMKIYVRVVLKLITRSIVLGESLKGQFKGLIREPHISVVPNGIESQGFNHFTRKNPSTLRYKILHLSTLSHLKGALVLLQAIPLVINRRRNVEFVFAGPWSHVEDNRWADQFIGQQGLAQYIQFTGQVEGSQKRTLLESAHVFIFPGVQQEGQPLVVLEAMAAGLPVIFTDRGCLRETVGECEGGLCVKINDPQDLADQIVWLIDHPEQMDEMGRAGRQRYEQFFTKEKHIAAMIEVFTSVSSQQRDFSRTTQSTWRRLQ